MTIPVWALILLVLGSMLTGIGLAWWFIVWILDRNAVMDILFRR